MDNRLYVDRIAVNGSGDVTFILDKSHGNPDSCSSTLLNYVRIANGNPGLESVVSLATSAALTRNKVRIHVDGCHGGYATFDSFALQMD